MTRRCTLLGLAMASSLAACQRTETNPLELMDGELLILAEVNQDSDGNLAITATLATALNAPLPVLARKSDRLYAWAIRRADLVGPDGIALGPDRIAAAKIGPLDKPAPAGSCNSCQQVGHQAPAVIHPGDRCSPPSFARLLQIQGPGDSADADQVRRQLRIDWPGACTCKLPAPPAWSDRIDFLPLLPAHDPWQPDAVAQTPDGTLGIFAAQLAMTITASGTRTVRTSTDADFPFEGHVWGAVGLGDGRFVVASYYSLGNEANRYVRFDVLSPTLERLESATGSLMVQPTFMRYFAEDQVWVALGQQGSRLSSLAAMECSAAPGASAFGDCTVIPLMGSVSSELQDATRTEDGVYVGLPLSGDLLFWKHRDSQVRSLPFADLAPPLDYRSIGHLQNRVFLCGDRIANGDSFQTSIYTATVSADQNQRDVAPSWKRIFCSTGMYCGNFSDALTAGAPGRLGFSITDGLVYLEFDADGHLVRGDPGIDFSSTCGTTSVTIPAAPPPPFPGPRPGRWITFNPGWAVGLGQNLVQRVRPPGTPDLAYGQALPLSGGISVIVPRPGSGFMAFDDGAGFPASGATYHAIAVDDRRATSIALPGFAPGEWISGVALDHRLSQAGAESYVALGFSCSPAPELCRSFIRRVNIRGANGSYSAETMPLLSPPQDLRLIDLAETNPGLFVVIADDDAIRRLDTRGGAAKLETVPFDWDDPLSPSQEGRATGNDCQFVRDGVVNTREGRGEQIWHRVVSPPGETGVAWVSGCHAALLRVAAGIEPPAIQAFSMARQQAPVAQQPYTPGVDDLPDLTALSAICPNELLIGAPRRNDGEPAGRVWWAAPAERLGLPNAADLDREEIYLGRYGPHYERAPSGIKYNYDLVGFVGQSPRLGVADSDQAGLTIRGYNSTKPPTPFTMPEPLGAAATADNGDVLIGTPRGQLLLSPAP